MKILDLIKNKRTRINFGFVALGILLGWIFFGGSGKSTMDVLAEDHGIEEHEQGTVWTCSMHPQIRESGPGNCPICGMELIPLESDESDSEDEGEYTIKLSKAAMKIAEVEMSTIEKKAPYKEIYLPGKVKADERNIIALTARFPGRIEKLTINFTGQKVRKGQILAKIYSPELVTAQRELFEAIKFKETNPSFYNATRNKLRLWDLTDKQISGIEESGEVNFYFDVLSPITGTVTMRHIAIGDYVKEGSALFEVVDLRHVWVMFDAYEIDIPWIKLGDNIKFVIKSIPGEVFESTVTFIDPVLNQMSRVAGVRTELNNRKDLLKPEMLAAGILKTMLPGSGDQIVVPKSAVLWTGKKAVVYVMTGNENNLFQFREIELGADAGNYYIVTNGLLEGEMVASNGVFKIDAAAQLKGEKSMMNPSGGKLSMGGHAGMDMGGDKDVDMEMKDEAVEDSEHDMENMGMNMETDPEFKKQLTDVFNKYLVLKDALVSDDANAASNSGKELKKKINNVDMGLLEGDAHMEWMKDLENINKSVEVITSQDDIEKQRLAFSDLGDALYASIKYYKVEGLGAFYQFCPMARDGEGAFWLSTTKDIKNPYLGEAMLTCGETKEEIK